MSQDGARFAFVTDGGIAVRDAGEREYRLLPGTTSWAESPSFSPDGAWIAFHDRGFIRRIAVSGGSAIALVPGDSLRAQNVHWGADGSIVFESGRGLYRIASQGGAPELLVGTQGAQSPRLLPDGSGVLYVDTRSGSKLVYYNRRAATRYSATRSRARSDAGATPAHSPCSAMVVGNTCHRPPAQPAAGWSRPASELIQMFLSGNAVTGAA